MIFLWFLTGLVEIVFFLKFFHRFCWNLAVGIVMVANKNSGLNKKTYPLRLFFSRKNNSSIFLLFFHFSSSVISKTSRPRALEFCMWVGAGGAARHWLKLPRFGLRPQKVYIWYNAKSSFFSVLTWNSGFWCCETHYGK